MAKNKEKFTPAQVIEYKAQILSILDAGGAKTLASAARAVGVSPTKVYDWNKDDNVFSGQVKQAQKVLADRLIEELLDDYEAKMPQVVAKIFIIKGLCPEFRDNFRTVEFKDERGVKILEELRRLAEKTPKVLIATPEPEENLLAETIKRVEDAKQSSD